MRLLARLVASLCLTALLASCGDPPNRESLRYKLTLEVTVDGVARRGSSVVEMVWGRNTGLGAGSTFIDIRRGEGVVVDLGPGHPPLVATLRVAASSGADAFGSTVLFDVYDAPSRGTGWVDGRLPAVRELKAFADTGPREISADQLPFLVTFENRENPRTVVEVNPYDLADTLGPGVSWGTITIEVTDDAVTDGVMEKVLPWVTERPKGPIKGTKVEDIRELWQLMANSNYKTE